MKPWVAYTVHLPVSPHAFAVVFGLQENDCCDDLLSIVEQLKAEAWGMA